MWVIFVTARPFICRGWLDEVQFVQDPPSIRLASDGGNMLNLEATGTPGTRVEIQASVDLIQWNASTIAPLTLEGGRATASLAQQGNQMFFRLFVSP